MLISIEGIDTAGKSTQAKLLEERLKENGENVITIHFPNYETLIGGFIKEIITTDKINSIDYEALQMLYVADQMNLQETISDYIHKGYYVILDRYDISTFVYYTAQKLFSNYKNISEAEILSEMKKTKEYLYDKLQYNLMKPDITFVLNLNTEEIFKRKQELDKIEKNIPLMNTISKIYSMIKKVYHNRKFIIIDASDNVNDIADLIYADVIKLSKLALYYY